MVGEGGEGEEEEEAVHSEKRLAVLSIAGALDLQRKLVICPSYRFGIKLLCSVWPNKGWCFSSCLSIVGQSVSNPERVVRAVFEDFLFLTRVAPS